jgi:superoxide dismutase
VLLRNQKKRDVYYLKIQIKEEIVNYRHSDYHGGDHHNHHFFWRKLFEKESCQSDKMEDKCDTSEYSGGSEKFY